MGETIVVVSDLHGNAGALRRAIAMAKDDRVDRWIVLGDLLTYGVDVHEVLDLVEALQQEGAVIIRGNHDEIYMNAAAGRPPYDDRVPAWVRESIDYTLSQIDACAFASRFEWKDEMVVGDTLFSHANPYGPSDWRYLYRDDDLRAAAAAVAGRGLRHGVFGHTHRPNLCATPLEPPDGGPAREPITQLTVTTGSVGQPRDRDRVASFLRIELAGPRPFLEFLPIDYDVRAHVRAIQSAPLTEATKERLSEFFVVPPASRVS